MSPLNYRCGNPRTPCFNHVVRQGQICPECGGGWANFLPLPYGVLCNWGKCLNPAVALRRGTDNEYLPVCAACFTSPPPPAPASHREACPACRRFFSKWRCNAPDECDCPRCQGLCSCGR